MTMSLSPDRRFFVFNAVVSSAAFAFLIWLTLIQNGVAGLDVDLSFVPGVNASLNALSAVLPEDVNVLGVQRRRSRPRVDLRL